MQSGLVRMLLLGIWCAMLGGAVYGAEDANALRLSKLQAEFVEALRGGDNAKALDKAKEIVVLAPKEADAHYNLACVLARQGDKAATLASLAKAIECGYSDPAHLKSDDDLAPVREDPKFAELVAGANKNDRKGEYEKATEMPDVKTVEDHPEGGMRFRLRMSPKATDAQPHRLIVWLHPSGGSMNGAVEKLVPQFIEKGFALLVLTKKQWAGWDGREMERLLEITLPEVDKIAGIDAAKPLLMGFSAGGQAALAEWAKKPDAFAGLILNSAAPLDEEKRASGVIEPLTLPKDEAIKKVPFFVVMGELEGGAAIWRKVEPDWRKAGIPLTLRWIAAGKHQWHFGKPQTEELGKWLSEVAAGKAPADK